MEYKYKVGDKVLIEANIFKIDRIDDDLPYAARTKGGSDRWLSENDILGLAADLLPQREPQAGDWVMVDVDGYKGKAIIKGIDTDDPIFPYLVGFWARHSWVKSVTPCDPPTHDEIIDMVLGGK